MRLFPWILFTGFFFYANVYAQSVKYGKVNPAAFSYRPSGQDSAANACMLFDGSYVVLTEGTNGTGYKAEYYIHRRILLLNEAGVSQWAEVSLPYHFRENISAIDGATFNLVNGEAVPTDLRRDQIRTETYSSTIRVKKFAMPDARPGSVIEYKYTHTSNEIFALDEIYLQHEIPVVQGVHEFQIPILFEYKYLMLGQMVNARQDQAAGNRTLFEVNDVPACRPEPYALPVRHRQARMKLQMKKASIYSILPSWDALYKELMVDDLAEESIRKYMKYKPEWGDSLPAVSDSAEWVAMAFSFVQHRFNAVGQKSGFYPDQTPKSLKNTRKGTPAEINLMLVATLRERGFQAYPVLSSTLDNEIVQEIHPMIRQFRHLLALVILEGKPVLMDASHPRTAWNLLPEDDLCRLGWVLKDQTHEWINITPARKYDENTMLALVLTDSLSLTGSMTMAEMGYAGLDCRDLLNGDSARTEPLAKALLGEAFPYVRLDSARIGQCGALSQALSLKATVTTSHFTEEAGDMVLIRPLRIASLEANPFPATSQERELSVMMRYPHNWTYSMAVTLPENYTVVELPKPVKAVLPENGGNIFYKSEQAGNRITLSLRVQLTRAEYSAAEYESLRNFFDILLQKLNEPVICQKN